MKRKSPLLPEKSIVRKRKIRSLSLGTALLFAFGSPVASMAQITLNCPPNMVVSTSPSSCDAVVNFNQPVVTGGANVDTTYSFTGSQQIFVVPAGVGQITIEAWGAQGQSNDMGLAGGLGGYATGILPVTGGETLYVYVGGGGSIATTGGYNGGGSGGQTSGCQQAFTGGGGGASDVRQGGLTLTDRVIVAGGGGGAGGNRVVSCGRGAGGGGGAGYYGGGGGAGWPGSGGTLPTGGTQSAGGMGGITTTSAGATNGGPGSLGLGGFGGDEVGSSQGGSATALAGGAGGGLQGGSGAYSQNWTGQSGAGGSGFVGTLGSASMQNGIRTGNGQIRIVSSAASVIVQTAGLPSGSLYPGGVTTNAFTATQNSLSASCSFTVTVQDLFAPVQTCPADTVQLALGANCTALLPDFTLSVNALDGCDPNPVVTQSLAAGSALAGTGSFHNMTTDAHDNANNASQCAFVVELVDTSAPVLLSCPPVLNYANSILDCGPMAVNFSLPTFSDNCAFTLQGSHNPGDVFVPGATVVTYQAADSAGNIAGCSFVVTVGSPVLDGVVASQAVCDGQPFTLTASLAYSSFAWSTGATTNAITSSTPGWFWVDVSDTSGCTGRDSVFYQYPALPSPVITAAGAQLCTGGFATYQWFQNSVLIPGANGPCYQPTTDGIFVVEVTDSIGCSGVSAPLSFVGVNEGLPVLAFEAFPNPVQDFVQVRLSQSPLGPATVRLFDLSGKLMQLQTFAQPSGILTVDMGALPAGTYLLQLSSEGLTGQIRVVKAE